MPGPFLFYLICFGNLYIKAGGGCKSLERARNPARLAHQGLSCVSVIAKGHVWHCEQPRVLHFFCSQTCTLWSMSKRLWPCRNLACLLTKGQILWPHSCFTRGRKFNIFINFHRYKNTRMLPFFKLYKKFPDISYMWFAYETSEWIKTYACDFSWSIYNGQIC